jgi:hypothetical protein
MPSNGDSNLDRLKDAGMIIGDEPLPEPFQHLVRGLTPHEVEMLVAVKNRLDAAGEWHGLEPTAPGELPQFTNFMVF